MNCVGQAKNNTWNHKLKKINCMKYYILKKKKSFIYEEVLLQQFTCWVCYIIFSCWTNWVMKSASSAIFTWPLDNQLHFKHLDNFLQCKLFHDQQEAEFVKSWRVDFHSTGISKLISRWQKGVDWNASCFD